MKEILFILLKISEVGCAIFVPWLVGYLIFKSKNLIEPEKSWRDYLLTWLFGACICVSFVLVLILLVAAIKIGLFIRLWNTWIEWNKGLVGLH